VLLLISVANVSIMLASGHAILWSWYWRVFLYMGSKELYTRVV